jgi:CBS domain-containing protein
MLRSVKAKDYMTKSLVKFRPEMNVYDAVEYLLLHKISGAPVVNAHGKLVGMFSESDCLRSILNATYYEGQGGGEVQEYMTTRVDTVGPEDDIIEIADYFLRKKRRRLPVVEDGQLVGQISRRDLLQAMKDFVICKEYAV